MRIGIVDATPVRHARRRIARWLVAAGLAWLGAGRAGAAAPTLDWATPWTRTHGGDDRWLASSISGAGVTTTIIGRNFDEVRAVTRDAAGAVTADVALDAQGASIAGLAVNGAGELIVAGTLLSATTLRMDVFAARYDAAGVLQWWASWDPGDDAFVGNVALDSAGNVMVVGWFGDAGSFTEDAVLVSWSGAGVFRWAATFDGGDNDEGLAVATDASGNAFLVGATVNTGTFLWDVFAARVDATGAIADSASYPYGVSLYGRAAAWRAATNELYIGADNLFDPGIFVADATNLATVSPAATWPTALSFNIVGGIAVDGSGNAILSTLTFAWGTQDYNLGVFQFDAALSPGWSDLYDAGGWDALGYPVPFARVGTDGSDNVYVSAAATPSPCQADTQDAFVRKYDAAGTELWSALHDSAPALAAMGTAVDAAAAAYLGVQATQHAWLVKHDASGVFQWAVEPSFAGLCPWEAGGVAHAAGSIYFGATGFNTLDFTRRARVARFSTAGAQTATYTFDRIYGASAGPVGVDTSGNVYLAGSFYSTTTFEDELFVVKFNSVGTILWTLTRSAAVGDAPLGLALDGVGGLYLVQSTPNDGVTNDVQQLLKVSATTGAVQWSRTDGAGGAFDAEAMAVAATPTEVYLAGSLEDPGVDLWGRLSRWTPSGNLVWSVDWDGGTDAGFLGVAFDPLGHLDVVGAQGDLPTDDWDALTASFDRQGTLRWSEVWDSGSPDDYGRGIALGSVYLGGAGGGNAVQIRYTEPAAAALFARLAFSPAAIKAGEWAEVVLTVTNAGSADADNIVPQIVAFSGAANATLVGGPAPAGPLTIAAGTTQSFTWTFSSNGGGNAVFSATATGDDASLLIPVLAAASGTLLWIPPCSPGLALVMQDAEPPYAGAGAVQTWQLAFSNPGAATVYNAVLTTGPGSFDQRSYVPSSFTVTVSGGATVSPLWALATNGPWTAGEPPGGTGVYLRWLIPQLDPGRSGLLSWRATLLGSGMQRVETYVSATASCDPAGLDAGPVAYTATGAGMRIAAPLTWRVPEDGGAKADDRYHAVVRTPVGFVAVGSVSRPDLAQGRNWLVRAFSVTGTPFWQATWNGAANGDDEATAVTVNAGGTVYVAGFESRADLAQGDNWMVRAYSPAGVLSWTRTHNSAGDADERALGLAVNAAGWVWVAGYEDRPDLGQGRDMRFEILDGATGAVLDASTYDSPTGGDEAVNAVAVSDAAGLVAVAGWEDVSAVGEGRNWRIFTLDAAGTLLWTATLDGGPGGDDEARGIAIHAGTGVVTAAGFTDRFDLAQGRNWTLRSFDRDGNVLWQSDFNAPANGGDEAAGLAVDPAGSVHAAGHEARPDLGTADDWRYRRLDNAGNLLDAVADDGLLHGNDRPGGVAVSGTAYAVVAGWEAARLSGEDAVRARYDPPAFAYPRTPTGLTARAAGPSILLQWGLPAAGTRATQGYRLYRATSPQVPFSLSRWLTDVGPSTTSVFVDAAVTSGERYYYRVGALDTLGAWSALSNEANAQLGAASLRTALAVTPFQGMPGQMFSIVLSVTNTGLAYAELVQPILGITTGAGSVTIFYGPSISGTVSLAPGSATRFEWTATGTAFGFIEFSATVNGWDAGLLTGIGAADTATVLIASLAVLTATMTIDPPSATIYVGQWITVTLSVTNTGGLIAQAVQPSSFFVLPGGLTWQSGPEPPGPIDLAPGGATVFVWTYSVSGSGQLVFTGSVSGTNGAGGLAAAWATDTRMLARPGRLAGSLSVTPGTAPAGVPVTVRASITNTGDEAVTGTWMPDFSWTTTGGLALSMLTGTVPVGPLTLPGRTSTVFTWTFTTSGEGGVTFTGTVFGQDASIFAFSRTVTLVRAACVIPVGVLTGRLRATPAVVTEGDTIRVVFTVSNSGALPVWSTTAAGSPAVSSTMLVTQLSGPTPPTDPLIGGCTTAGCVTDRSGCPQTRFTWTYQAIGSGTVDFSASVFWTEPIFGIPMVVGDLSNTVFIMPAPRLVASVSADPPAVRYGRPVTFRLTVTNTGGATVWNLAPGLTPPDPRLLRVDLAPAVTGATLANGASMTWTWVLTALDGGTGALNASVSGIFDSVSGTVATTTAINASAGTAVTITPRPEGDLVVFPHPVTTDRATVYFNIREDALQVDLEAWDTSMHRVYAGEWRNVSWLDAVLTLEGLKRWAPGIYLLRARATFADGTTKVFPVFKMVVKP